VELTAATHQLRVGGRARICALHLLQVVDVLDLRVRAKAVVIPAEVRLPIREEDRLIAAASERWEREVPPLRREERGQEYRERDEDVADARAVEEKPPAESADASAKGVQRVGLGDGDGGRAVGAAVAGIGVAGATCPDLKRLMRVTMSLSSRMFSTKMT
jgi:hypothetical protein